MAQIQRLNGMTGALANDVELAFQIILIHFARAARDKYLADHRLNRDGRLRETVIVGRHIAPAQ